MSGWKMEKKGATSAVAASKSGHLVLAAVRQCRHEGRRLVEGNTKRRHH